MAKCKDNQKGQGKMTYVPKIVLIDLKKLMERKNIKIKSKAFSEMAAYARVGIEAENILKFRFPDAKSIFKKRRKKR